MAESFSSNVDSILPNKIDIIICSDVIEHLIDPDLLLNYIKNLSSKNSIIYLSTPDRDRMRGKSCMKSLKKEHIREWNYSEFKAYIADRGFQIIDHIHLKPLKFSFSNFKNYLQILLNKTINFDGKKFKYNQLIVCRVSK